MSRWFRLSVIIVEWFIRGMVLLVVRCGSRVVRVVLVVVLVLLWVGVLVLGWVGVVELGVVVMVGVVVLELVVGVVWV